MTLGVSVAEIVENSNNPLLAIHPSWKRILLGDVARVLNGFAFKSSLFNKDDGFPLIRIRDIGNSETDVYYAGEYDETYVVKHGDLLVGMDGDFNSARWTGKNALLNQRVCKIILDSPEYHPKFLEYSLPGYLKAINDHTSAVTVKHLSSKTITEIPLPFPSLSEQARIVAKIEDLFTQLDAGTAALHRVKAEVKRYKASVLKAAVEGKLGIRNDEFRMQDDGQLPAGWRTEKLGSIFQVKIGKTPSRSKPEFWNGDIHWVSSGEVINSRIRDTREKITAQGLGNTKLYPVGTVLLAMIGEGKTRGQAAILDIEATTNQNIAAILANSAQAIPEWVFYWLLSRYEETRKSGVGGMQYALNSERIRNFDVPLPPLEEQRRIVAEVERRLSLAAGVESTLAASMSRAARLRQSVLKSAFEGRLV